MADIFISYKSEEQPIAKKLADALQKKGWTVWWDPEIRAGERFDDVIEKALIESKCVVVLWSKLSVESQNVKDEATYALNRDKLVPILIEEVNLPFRFERINTGQLIDWDGSNNFPGFQKLIADVISILGEPPVEEEKRKREQAERDAEKERRRKQEAERKLREDEKKKAEEERQRLEEEQHRLTEEKRKFEKEQKRIEAARKSEEERKQKGAEAKRKAEEERKQKQVKAEIRPDKSEPDKIKPSQPKPDTKAATEPSPSQPISPKPRKASNALKFGAVAGATVLLIVGISWYISDSKKVKPRAQEQILADSELIEKSKPQKAITNSIGMKFVLIPAGNFVMGSPPDEPQRNDNEKQHEVNISKPFYLQTTEASQAQWKRVMGDNPSNFKNCGDDCPVEKVSWDDAQKFISKLNQMEDTNKYRLPTEAEWEYACRARTETAYSFGDRGDKLREYGWYRVNSENQTHPGGEKKPNDWGLYDMHGNVWEWCQDWYGDYPSNLVIDPKGHDKGQYRVLRGGSWVGYAWSLRSAYRDRSDPDFRYFSLGFRVARDF